MDAPASRISSVARIVRGSLWIYLFDEDIGILVEQLAAPNVIETLRRVHRTPLPDAELVVECHDPYSTKQE